MAKYLISALCERDTKKAIGVMITDANSKRQATTRFWQGNYTTLIDNGGTLISLVIHKLKESEEQAWLNIR